MNQTGESNRINILDLITLILSIYVLGALIVDTIFKLNPEVSVILNYFDTVICIVFFYDFILRFYKSDNKLRFMKWGWIDLLSSIPNVGFLRFGRALRVIRLLRILRAFRSTKLIVNVLFKHTAKGTLSTVFLLTFFLVIFSSISILQFETSPDSNIKTAEDAIWWSFTTITTVGYGDKFPVTTEGRIIAMLMMTAGVGLFGTFTAYVASFFVNKDQQKREVQ